MSLVLSPDEIAEITGKTQPAAQIRHLRRMGIRAERRSDGSVCVVREWLADRPRNATQSKPRLKSERHGQAA